MPAGSGDCLNKDKQTNSCYCNITNHFHKCIQSTFYHNCKWLQLSMTRQTQYKFLYSVHNITTVHCAVPLSLLSAQHSQTVLNTEQCGVVRQRAVSNSNNVCNYSNGDMLRSIIIRHKNIHIINRPPNYTAFQHKYNYPCFSEDNLPIQTLQ